MGMVRFRLEGVSAFRDLTRNGDGRHFCVKCARKAVQDQALIPFLDDQLSAVLSDFGRDMGAMLSCDQCGQILGTYYPENFWDEKKQEAIADHKALIFKKF